MRVEHGAGLLERGAAAHGDAGEVADLEAARGVSTTSAIFATSVNSRVAASITPVFDDVEIAGRSVDDARGRRRDGVEDRGFAVRR
jgi:hypothetical protein